MLPATEASGPIPTVGAPAAVLVRPRWWTQVLLVAAVWWSYDTVNNLNPLRAATALAHGSAILRLETSFHVAAERGLNAWLAAHLLLGKWLGNYYDMAHFGVTIGVLVWLWWRHPGHYGSLRNALLGMNLIGFVVYWAYPVAPPRMLAGFVDIVAVTHAVGEWSGGALASKANEYAAMPSLHVAWALWCTLAVWCVRKDARARALAVAYTVFTALAVMATANHYFLDVLAGVATAGVASFAILARMLQARRRRTPVPAVGLEPVPPG